MTVPEKSAQPPDSASVDDYPSDEATMRAIQAGHLDLLGVLYRRHRGSVSRQCSGLIGESDIVDDLVQESFLRVLRYRESFRGEARFSTWLYRIARNVCLDHLTGMKKEVAIGDELSVDGDGVSLPPSGGGVAPPISESERVSVLRSALAMLPEEKRELLTLYRLEGLTYAQLSRRFGVSEGALRVRVHRAMTQLKAIFDSLWDASS